MNRRAFFYLTFGSTAVAWPRIGVVAQISTRRPLVAGLSGLSSARGSPGATAFAQRLEELGYIAGRDIDIVYRYADGDAARIPSLVDELVRLKPDVMVASSAQVAVAMRQASAVIPIVVAVIGNANNVALGLVAPHARPEGNVTGILNNVDTLPGKVLELAAEIVRGAAKMGLLLITDFQQHAIDRKSVEAAAAVLAIGLVPVEVRGPHDLDAAFQTFAHERVNGVLVSGHPMFLNERGRIATLAIGARLPTVFPFREHVDAGGLMSYGVDLRANFRRGADFVDKILKGAKLGDLPVELPTKFELVINLKTAKAIGLSIPESLLARADEVIE